MKITMTGSVYSGKSTVAKRLAEDLKIKLYNAGEIQRHLAEEKGMSIKEYNEYMENMGLDKEVDMRTEKIGKNEDNFIFDARLAWFFIPDSYKIFLKVQEDTAVKRAMEDKRRSAENYITMEEARKNIRERMNLESTRFKRLYGADLYDMNNYDLVVDTSPLTEEEVYNYVKKKVMELIY